MLPTATPGSVIRTFAQHNLRGEQTGTRQLARGLASTGTYVDLATSRSYNAFSETDARGAVTSYAYNTMGRVTLVTRPLVSWTDETAHDRGTTRLRHQAC